LHLCPSPLGPKIRLIRIPSPLDNVLPCDLCRLRCDYLSGSEEEEESGDEYQRDAAENMMADTLANIQPVRQQAAPDPPFSSPVNHPGDDQGFYERVSSYYPGLPAGMCPICIFCPRSTILAMITDSVMGWVFVIPCATLRQQACALSSFFIPQLTFLAKIKDSVKE
jgi:hypothetical protein